MKKLLLMLLALLPLMWAQEAKADIDTLDVTVKTPGTLSSRILMKGVDLEEVYALRVSGSINDEDWKVIKNNITNLNYLDLSGTDISSVPAEQFKESNSILEVVLPPTTKSIDEYAFYKSSLERINLPEGLENIWEYAFSLSSLDSIHFPEGLKRIANNAFEESKLKGSIVIPSSIISWDGHLIPDNNTIVGYVIPTGYQFYGTGITKLVIQDGCKLIPYHFCNNCVNLEEVDIASSVSTIRMWAFRNCSKLSSIKLHQAMPSSICVDDYDPFYGIDKSKVILYVPLYASTKYINDPYWSAFGKIRELFANIQINVTSIGGEVMLDGKTARKETSMEEDATMSIDKEVFSNVTLSIHPDTGYKIDKITLNGEEVTANEDGTLTLLEIDDNYNVNVSFYRIKKDGLYYDIISEEEKTCKLVASNEEYSGEVVIPNAIMYQDFEYKVTEIDDRTFYNSSLLTSVTIPSSVASIGISAFEGCTGLTSITIPNGVTSIGERAFVGCKGLTSITLPNSITCIKKFVFAGCSGLTSITIPNSVISIGLSAFYDCSGLLSVTIPNSVTSIGGGAFYGCSGLTSITIPGSVTSIENHTFYGCTGLTSITIPNSVTSIGAYAFDGCSGLREIVSLPSTPPSCKTNTFNDVCKEECIVKVPEESIAAYSAAEMWKEFWNIVSLTEADVIWNIAADIDLSNASSIYSLDGIRVNKFALQKGRTYIIKVGDRSVKYRF